MKDFIDGTNAISTEEREGISMGNDENDAVDIEEIIEKDDAGEKSETGLIDFLSMLKGSIPDFDDEDTEDDDSEESGIWC